MIIIPDVHGRTFWKKAKKYDGKIVFLGDYIDPYPYEGISNEEAIMNFEEIIKFKKDNPEKVELLLGNHDCGYIWNYVCKCRRDYTNYNYVNRLFNENLNLFNIGYIVKSKEKTYILSHAGIRNDTNFVNMYNKMLHSNNTDEFNKLGDILSEVSRYRGGWSETGSCVWADVHEWVNYKGSIYQIFGHTQLLTDDPIITECWADLDCRHVFRLNLETNKIEKYD